MSKQDVKARKQRKKMFTRIDKDTKVNSKRAQRYIDHYNK